MELVILVDEEDREIGVAEKLEAHRNGGQLHRAFSIFVLNDRTELLIQKRQADKYHFGGLWSNTCCGHPRPQEPVDAAAERRLVEEFGFRAELKKVSSILYRAADERSGLTEQEYLHLFVGRFQGEVVPAPCEIEDWRWVNLREVELDMVRRADLFTPWFRPAFEQVRGFL